MDTEEGSQPKSYLKIHDFTRSRILENNQMEKTFKQDPMLVNHFSSPEILSNNDYNHKTDVWSVGKDILTESRHLLRDDFWRVPVLRILPGQSFV